MDRNKIIKKYLTTSAQTQIFDNLIAFEASVEEIVDVCNDLYHRHGLPLKTITALDERKDRKSFKIMYIFGVPQENLFIAPFIQVKNEEFPSIVNTIHEASWYERRIKTFFGLKPLGHPSSRSIILHENWPSGIFPLRKDFDWQTRPEEGNTPFEFQKVEGEGVYEIPVGPVHAGIIEPGHFRFSVIGEEIVLLEPRLGYKHKGTEKLFEVLPLGQKIKLAERVSGDSSFSHSLAFCQAVESLAGVKVPVGAQYLRVIFAELERVANHLGDIGAIMLDAGFNFGGSNGARLRELMMQWLERLTGSRFLRGVNTIGGVTKNIAEDTRVELSRALEKIKKDFAEVISIAENSSSLLNRLKNTGELDEKIAKDHGVVGVAAKALGLAVDARVDFPYAAYDKCPFEPARETGGDVYSRFFVRVKEVFSSLGIIQTALRQMPAKGAIAAEKIGPLKKDFYAVSVVEGWRGDIVYFVATDPAGEISRVSVRDPSFLNWAALGHAGKGNMVPDFPLINKSFDLSYSGYDR